jgi:hypothetical protein
VLREDLILKFLRACRESPIRVVYISIDHKRKQRPNTGMLLMRYLKLRAGRLGALPSAESCLPRFLLIREEKDVPWCFGCPVLAQAATEATC